MVKKILILHGSRQTGDLLLGRMDKLKRAVLRELGWELIAPDAPHLYSIDIDDDDNLRDDCANNDSNSQWQRTWWHRKDNVYDGIDRSISMLLDIWLRGDFVGILGFSQGSRLAHIVSILHNVTNMSAFDGLKFVVHVSGYGDCPLPDNFFPYLENEWGLKLSSKSLEVNVKAIPSLHVMGEQDKLILPQSSLALMAFYENPVKHVHSGGHHVPVKACDMQTYLQFFRYAYEKLPAIEKQNNHIQPDDDHAQSQIDEIVALSQIFPSEFKLLSESTLLENADPSDYSEESRIYHHPIRYSILLQSPDQLDRDQQLWPRGPISLSVEYLPNYPDSSPTLSLIHDMNYLEFSMRQSDALMKVLCDVMAEEIGMPCIMSVIYAGKAFFESNGLAAATATPNLESSFDRETYDQSNLVKHDEDLLVTGKSDSGSLKPSGAKRNDECIKQGLEIAYDMLRSTKSSDGVLEVNGIREKEVGVGKGGSWKYTIGLVGKPSAGKSTFFNAATAFARQRGAGSRESSKDDDVLDGAAMAPHPFTTIDPNIGFCLVPAPAGSCPEDVETGRAELAKRGFILGSTHGRDSKARRLISLCLKDVAGLVPGAYQGRGKGNKFLDDLTDADVLVHVVDASGLSDTEGNKVTSDDISDETNHPITDLAWVRHELVEWVFFNIASKWDNVLRRGKDKLVGMFSGYKQSQAFVVDVFSAVEAYVREKEGKDRTFDHLDLWDEGDLHRLVSAFLGIRFPMVLALNKCDLPSSAHFISDIKAQLPIHGAHVGVELSAHKEMQFMRHYIGLAKEECKDDTAVTSSFTHGVLDCLQSAIAIRAPVLVFPVNDMMTYEPMPGMINYATRDASLPSQGMISCLVHAGGCAPSQWDADKHVYSSAIRKNGRKSVLRDVLLMKPGSTVEDVFLMLKHVGALEGEFVRAEGAMNIGEKPKLVSKNDIVGVANRILRIMTTKRRAWQEK